MNRYAISVPRIALGFAALTLSVFAGALLVVAPAQWSDQQGSITARSKDTAPQVREVSISPARIDIVASRTPIVVAAGTPTSK